MRKAPDLAISARRLDEIQVGEGMGLEAARLDAEVLEKMIANEVRRLTEHAAQTQVDAGLTKMDG